MMKAGDELSIYYDDGKVMTTGEELTPSAEVAGRQIDKSVQSDDGS